MPNEKKILRKQPPRQIGRMVESVIGCKWSLTVLELVRRGVTRPGAMERSVDGLSAKVLADCLRSLLKFGVLSKESFPEVPLGRKFLAVLETLDDLEADMQVSQTPGSGVQQVL
jgi:DNA-binding HxlR family transcriptional regulator